jgi:uncharacterized protein
MLGSEAGHYNLSSPEQRLAALEALLGTFRSAAVAFSGGVDSTLVLRVARDVLGPEQVVALTVSSLFSPGWEQDESRRLAATLGIRQEILTCALLQVPEVVANGPRRCYHCKRAIMGLCLERVRSLGMEVLLDGSNVDDRNDYRPGSQALRELGIRSPLAEAGLTKEDIRHLSGRLGLPTAGKAASACLATRIPFGRPVTGGDIAQVEACERYLHRQGLRNYRARHHGDTVRIEIPEQDLVRLVEPPLREGVVAACRKAGFRYVTLDLEGYRQGRMNEELPLNPEGFGKD